MEVVLFVADFILITGRQERYECLSVITDAMAESFFPLQSEIAFALFEINYVHLISLV